MDYLVCVELFSEVLDEPDERMLFDSELWIKEFDVASESSVFCLFMTAT